MECERPLLEFLIPGNMLEGVIYKIARDEYSADSNPLKTLPAKKALTLFNPLRIGSLWYQMNVSLKKSRSVSK